MQHNNNNNALDREFNYKIRRRLAPLQCARHRQHCECLFVKYRSSGDAHFDFHLQPRFARQMTVLFAVLAFSEGMSLKDFRGAVDPRLSCVVNAQQLSGVYNVGIVAIQLLVGSLHLRRWHQ
jgi:hypothetical protein